MNIIKILQLVTFYLQAHLLEGGAESLVRPLANWPCLSIKLKCTPAHPHALAVPRIITILSRTPLSVPHPVK